MKTEGGRNAALWMQTFGFIEEEEGKVQLVFNLIHLISVCEGAKRTIQHVFKTLQSEG